MTRGSLALALAVGGFLVIACTRTDADRAVADARGRTTVSIKGSDTMVILGQRWAEEYMKVDPTVAVQVTGGGSGTGIAALINGSADICESSRAMREKEKADLLAKRGQPAMETKVAVDALAIYVNQKSPVHEVAIPTLAKIYSGAITTWKEVGGPDRGIVLYGRESSSGTYGYFREHVLENADFAPATQMLAGTSAVANAVKGDELGIGYGGVAYLEGVRALGVKKDATSKAVVPSLRTAEDGSYPLTRYLYFYTAGEPTAAMKKLVAWVVGPDGQRTVSDVGYYPLPGATGGAP